MMKTMRLSVCSGLTFALVILMQGCSPEQSPPAPSGEEADPTDATRQAMTPLFAGPPTAFPTSVPVTQAVWAMDSAMPKQGMLSAYLHVPS